MNLVAVGVFDQEDFSQTHFIAILFSLLLKNKTENKYLKNDLIMNHKNNIKKLE